MDGKVGGRRCLEKGLGLPDKFIPAAGGSPSRHDSATRMPKDGTPSPEKSFDVRASALLTKSSARRSLSAIPTSPSTGKSLQDSVRNRLIGVHLGRRDASTPLINNRPFP